MREFLRVMKALSDGSRVKIVKMLGRKELCVCELTALLGLAQPTVSKHLRVLEEAGLVTFRKEGSWINYRLARDGASGYAAAMVQHLDAWLEDDPEVCAMAGRLAEADRRLINPAG
ncbi:MAG: metalloregulator ArsR/SmtB family transcription factor [Thermodesulfobacteriota bacterium]